MYKEQIGRLRRLWGQAYFYRIYLTSGVRWLQYKRDVIWGLLWKFFYKDSLWRQKNSLGRGCLVINLDVQLCPPLSLGSPSALSCHNEKLTRVTKSKTVLLHGILSVKRVSSCRREEASPVENSCSFDCSPAHVGDEHTGSTNIFILFSDVPGTNAKDSYK